MASRADFIRQITAGAALAAIGGKMNWDPGVPAGETLIDNPYEGINWKKIQHVPSASHVHVTDQQKLDKVCNILKLKHIPISNYYPSTPYFPPEKIMKNQFMTGQQFGTVYDSNKNAKDKNVNGKYKDGPLDWNKIIKDPETGWYNSLTDERKKQMPFREEGPLFTNIPSDVIFSPNSEHHTFTDAKNLHANALGSFFSSGTFDAHNEFLTWDNGYCPGTGQPWQAVFGKILDELQYTDSGGITINHPVWSGLSYESVCSYLDYDERVLGIEVFNDLCATRYGDPELGWSLKMWDQILSSGRKCFGFFVPDWTVGRGKNILLTRDISSRDCLRAYRKGAFYGAIMGNGLRFNNISLENNILLVETSTESTIRLVSEKGQIFKEETDGRIEFRLKPGNSGTPDYSYIRIEAYDETSEQLFSQPIRFISGQQGKGRVSVSKKEADVSNPRYSSYVTIYDLIKNEVPGVRVSGTTISLIGQATYAGSSEPLFVVDGIPSNSISDVAPSDVKSVKVIKGGEAAYYGVQGANGVLEITTLRGNDKK